MKSGGALSCLVGTATLSCLVVVIATTSNPARSDEPRPGMILIPAGPFIMGSDLGGEEDEHPAHKVELKAFYIDKYEVTNAQYKKCMDAGKCKEPLDMGDNFNDPERPVVGVSWWDAESYCAFVGKRLLTEAEWEKAARGPDGQMYPWGNDPPGKEHGCYGFAEGNPCKPGSYPAGDSPYGVADMAGNVWEWIADVYDASFYPRSPARDPRGGTCEESLAFFNKLRRDNRQGYTGSNPIPKECEHVLRGGAWNYGARGLRSSNRVHHHQRFRIKVAGIRCGADAP